MKALIIVLLVLLMLAVGLPLAMGMGDMAPCPNCSALDVSFAVGMCLALFAVGGIFIALAFSGRVRQRNNRSRRLLVASGLERPPQYA